MISVSNGRFRSRGTYKRHLAGLRVQLAVVMPGPRVEPLRRALVPLGPAQLVGLRFQQAVERLLDRLPHHLVHVRANLLLLDPNHALKVRAACQSCYIVHRAVLSCW